MRKLLLGAAIGAILIGSGVAVASIPDAQGVIHACRKADGNIKVIDTDAGQHCAADATPLNWNQTGPQGPAGPAGEDVTVETVVRHYDTSTPDLSSGGGHVIETVPCPAGKQAIMGGVRRTDPDASAPADAYPGAARQDNREGWNIEGENGRLVGLPRPVNNDTAWRLAVWIGLAYTQNPTVFYPIDVSYFVACG